jgi:hypothetical protein
MMSPVAYADAGLKLHPGSFGANTEGAWKSKQGLLDSKGNARHALCLQKVTETFDFAAAYAVVDNNQGLPAEVLTDLSWEHRHDGERQGLHRPGGHRQPLALGALGALALHGAPLHVTQLA